MFYLHSHFSSTAFSCLWVFTNADISGLYLKYLSSSPTLHLHCCILTFSLACPMPKLLVMQRVSIFFHSELTITPKAQMVSAGATRYTFQINQKCLSTEVQGETWLPARFQDRHLNICQPTTRSEEKFENSFPQRNDVNSRSLKSQFLPSKRWHASQRLQDVLLTRTSE